MLKAILLMLVLMLVPATTTTIAIYADSKDNDDGKYDRLKETCSNYGDGKWEDGECKISDIEEEGAYEDYICDHPRPGIPYEEVCHSATLAFASSDKDKDDKLTERDVDVLCDASEDYEAHKEQCDKLYDNVKEQDTDLEFPTDEPAYCEDNDGIWKDDSCHYGYDEDGDKLNVINNDYDEDSK